MSGSGWCANFGSSLAGGPQDSTRNGFPRKGWFGLIKPVVEPGVGKIISRTVRGPAWRVDFAVRFDHGPFVIHFADTLAQVAEELIERVELFLSGFFLVEVADQTDAESDVVQVVTVYMPAVDLSAPAITNFDLAISGGRSIADNELVGEAVWHLADVGVVELKCFGVALPCSAVVDD